MQLAWPLPHRLELRDELEAAYSTDRGYHDLQHLTEVLDRIDELGAGGRIEVVLAAWFHDAVYDPAESVPGANEERSARLAMRSLAAEDVDAAEVARLVRLTATHRPEAGDTSGEILCDADLAILASSTRRYDAYASGVRAEYARYDDAAFAVGRIAVLEDLLAKPYLFHTAYARKHWEAVARANVTAELVRLRGKAGAV
ncbi:MAG: hypothetical protein QM655_05925 [Nocardioidaceae bacterium]